MSVTPLLSSRTSLALGSVQATPQAAWLHGADAEAAIVHSSLATFSRALRRKLPNMKIKEKSLTGRLPAYNTEILLNTPTLAPQ